MNPTKPLLCIGAAALYGAAYFNNLPVTPSRVMNYTYHTEVRADPPGTPLAKRLTYEKSLARERLTLDVYDAVAQNGLGEKDIILEKERDAAQWRVAFMHPYRHDPAKIGYRVGHAMNSAAQELHTEIFRRLPKSTRKLLGKTPAVPKSAPALPVGGLSLGDVVQKAEREFNLKISLNPEYAFK